MVLRLGGHPEPSDTWQHHRSAGGPADRPTLTRPSLPAPLRVQPSGLPDRLDPGIFSPPPPSLVGLANLCLLVSGFDNARTILLRFVFDRYLHGRRLSYRHEAGGRLGHAAARSDDWRAGGGALLSALPNLFNALEPLDWQAVTVVTSSVIALSRGRHRGRLCVALGPSMWSLVAFVPTEALRLLRRRSVTARQPRLSRPHVGTLRDVGVDRAVHRLGRTAGGRPGPAGEHRVDDLRGDGQRCRRLSGGRRDGRQGRPHHRDYFSHDHQRSVCAATIGLSAGLGIGLVILIAVIWGVTVIADSAQFSASIVELSEPSLVGTMLTVQTCLGFLLTFVAIQLMPIVVAAVGWRYAFVVLALGPAPPGAGHVAALRSNQTQYALPEAANEHADDDHQENLMTYETLLFEKLADGIGLVTLNRPKRANAISQHMLRELDDLCMHIRADRDLRVVVVTGAGMAFPLASI